MTTIERTAPAELAQRVEDEMARCTVPGLAFGVLRDGEVQAWGFGVTSIETEQPVTPGTLFQVGSITKVFTTTVVMQLVDEGKLDLDAPVSTYLTDLTLSDEATTRAVTMRHLLTHTAGFYGDRFDDYGIGDDALAKAVADFAALRQYTPPGESWAYCNTGFQLAGRVIEHFTGTTVEKAIAERIFKPLGMERSFFFADEAIVYPVAVGHNKLPEKELEVARRYPLTRAMTAAGAIISTVGDLLKFAAFHMGDGTANGERVLSDASRQAMQVPQVEAGLAEHWGLGWAHHEIEGVTIVEHGGSTNGFNARLTLVPERKVALAFLTNGNRGHTAIRPLETWALAEFAGLHRQDPAPTSMSAEALDRFTGRYERPNVVLTVTRADDRLRLDAVATSPLSGETVKSPPMHLVPVGERRFLVVDGDSTGGIVDFFPREGGRPRFIRFGGRLADRVADA